MARRQSKRQASKQATALMTATAWKHRVSKKLRLPEGTIIAQDAIRIKRLAEAREAGERLKVLGLADDPIKEFNKCMFFSFSPRSLKAYLRITRKTVKDNDKELVMKNLVLGFCKFFYEDGVNLVPADTQYYSKTGIPDADRAILRGARFYKADKSEDEDEDKDMGIISKRERDDNDKTIYGEPRWPPNMEISGNCL